MLAFGLGPRLAFLFVWIFGDRVDAAYDTWVWPLLGVLFAPWTALFYALAWGPLEGVSGWGWVAVAFGIVLDVASYVARFVRQGYRSARSGGSGSPA